MTALQRDTRNASGRFFAGSWAQAPERTADHIRRKSARLQEARAPRALLRGACRDSILACKNGSCALQIRFFRIRREPRRHFRLDAFRDELAADPESAEFA
jgi:hypothetical protein